LKKGFEVNAFFSISNRLHPWLQLINFANIKPAFANSHRLSMSQNHAFATCGSKALYYLVFSA
jgi:hypothetical protein